MCRQSIIAVASAFVLTFGTMAAHGTSYYFPKFGTPIVTPELLVFSGPGWEPHKIMCISRDSGERRWEIKDDTATLHPHFLMDGAIVITKGAAVYSCDLNDGGTKPLYATGYERCGLAPHHLPSVLITGEKENIDFLALVDLRQGKKLWEVSRMSHIVAKGDGVLLCNYSEREPHSSGGYSRINQKLVALSDEDGKVLWEHRQPQALWHPEGVAVGNYFVVNLGGTIHCLDQKTGRVVKKLEIQADPLTSVSLAERDGAVFVWTRKGRDVFSGHVVYSVTVPELVKSEVAETDWYSAVSHIYKDIAIGMTIGRMDTYDLKTGKKIWQGGQWNWEGIHDGFIFFSTMDEDGKHTSVNKIKVESGERALLYRELLPDDMQMKTEGQRSNPASGDYRN